MQGFLAEIGVSEVSFGELGGRMDVFEKTPPACVYVPDGSDWLVSDPQGSVVIAREEELPESRTPSGLLGRNVG